MVGLTGSNRIKAHTLRGCESDRPRNGLGGDHSDLLEADFELGTRRFSVIQEKGGRQLAFQMKIVPRRGVQRLGSLLDELVCHP
jgi:hypothetical protein